MKRIEIFCVCLLLGVLGTVLFRGSLDYPMVFDDEIYLRENPIFKDAQNFKAIFYNFKGVATMASKLGIEGDVSTNFLMRPLTYLSFHWNYRLGALNPWGFRFVNIAIHSANALLVWYLAHLLVLKSGALQAAVPRARHLIPSLSCLLFFVHPLQIESVIYIIQRATSLCTLFYLCALIAHIEATTRSSGLWRTASVLCALGAMFSKETGVTVPVLAVALDVAAFQTPLRQACWRARSLLVLLPILPLLLAAVSYAQTGALTGGSVVNIASNSADPAYGVHYALTQPSVWLRYLGLLAWPVGLNIDPDVALVKNLTDVRFWGASLSLVFLFGAAAWSYTQPLRRATNGAIFVGALWFALTLLPDSSLVPLPDCMAEHRTYLSSVGFCLVAATLVCSIPFSQGVVVAIAVVMTLSLSATTFARSKVWASTLRLWRDACDKKPLKARPWLNLGAAYFEAGKLEASEDAFIQSIQVAPSVPAFANLACVNLHRNQPQRAYDFARMGLQCRPSGYDPMLLMNLGDSCRQLRLSQEAIDAYREALQLIPSRLDIRLRLCDALLQTMNTTSALEVLQEGVVHHPKSPELEKAIATVEGMKNQFRLRLGP